MQTIKVYDNVHHLKNLCVISYGIFLPGAFHILLSLEYLNAKPEAYAMLCTSS